MLIHFLNKGILSWKKVLRCKLEWQAIIPLPLFTAIDNQSNKLNVYRYPSSMHRMVSKSTDFSVAAKYILPKILIDEQIVKLIVNILAATVVRFPSNRFVYLIKRYIFWIFVTAFVWWLSMLYYIFILCFQTTRTSMSSTLSIHVLF